MKKNDFKTVLIVLAVILFGYVYFMGGIPRTVEQFKEGKYFNFEDKSLEGQAGNNTNLNIVVEIYNKYDRSTVRYSTTISSNKRAELVKNFSGITLTVEEINNLISKYSLNKISDYRIWESSKSEYIENPKYVNYEIIELTMDTTRIIDGKSDKKSRDK